MILFFRAFLPAALFSLSACGAQGPVADKAENAAALPAPATVNSSDPSGGAPPPNALSRQVKSGSSSGSVPAIPARLHGSWGLNPEDCFPERGDNKGALHISGSEIRFFESVATPAANASASEDRYSADFSFTGEGQSWTRFQSLEMQDGKLVRTESSPMASYTYAKCS